MCAAQLFLSYNSADRASVVAVQRLLEARGITTFLDHNSLVPGIPWPQAIEQALKDVRAVAVFIGRDGFGVWQKRESYLALARQADEERAGRVFPVIPVLLPGAHPTLGFLFLNTWIDLGSGLDGVLAAEALDAFERAIQSTERAPIGKDSAALAARGAAICPYRGLQVFREDDAAFFFGRRTFAGQLLDFTLRKNVVAVVGPSGSGKSSLVQAGLTPLLRRQRPPADTWDLVDFTPGNDPFRRLASALIPLLEPDKDEVVRLAEAEQLGADLAGGKTKVEAVVSRVIEKSNGTGRLLLVADQFEELFTLTPEPSRRPFARALLRALGNAPFALLVALRADFYSQIITLDRELSDRLAPAQVTIGALTRDELRESITEPSKLVGLEFEPGLVERILTDVGSEPGRLPLLEFALTELWQRRAESQLTNRAYDEIGGTTGALAQRAETEFARLTPDEQIAARRVFSRLVRLAKPEEAGEETRQRADLSEADTLTRQVANRLADARLLVTGGDASKRTMWVEIAHEALIRNWERLRGWLNEDREFLLWRQRLQVQVREWQEHKSDASYLLRGTPLSEAQRWFADRGQDLAESEQDLIRQSNALAEANAEAERGQALRRLRLLRNLRAATLALGISLVVALFLAAFAFWQRALASAREMVSASMLSVGPDPEVAVLASARAIAATWPWGHTVFPEAEQEFHRAILSSRVRLTMAGHSEGLASVAWSPDGTRLATGSWDKAAKLWDAKTGEELRTLRGHKDAVWSVGWSPDGKWLATGSVDKTAKVWDPETGIELLTLTGHGAPVRSVAWSPDGKRLATGSYDTTARVWDVETGKEMLTLKGHRNCVSSVAWSPDGKRLATGSFDLEQAAKVWDAGTGEELLTLSACRGPLHSVVWSRDGTKLATEGEGNTVKTWDAETGKALLTLPGHSEPVDSVTWSPDGGRLATGSDDKAAIVWDLTTRMVLVLSGHTGPIRQVAWSPDGKKLATASDDKTAKVWEITGGKELLTLGNGMAAFFSVVWSPDGNRLATGSQDTLARVWDAATGVVLQTLRGPANVVESVAWSPDGKRLATVNIDKTAEVWNVTTGEGELILRGHTDTVRGVSWSPDGTRVATGSQDGTVKVWDAATGRELLTLNGNKETFTRVAWSPDGKRVAAIQLRTARVWDAKTGRELLTLGGDGWILTSVAWSPDGKRLATGSIDKTARVWDARTGKQLLTLTGHRAFVMCVAWSPDGKRLATGSQDTTVKVWDAATGSELLTLGGQTNTVHSVAWSPDGRRLAAASADGTVQVYAMDIRDLMVLARQRVTAHPSEGNCKKYLHLDRCPSVPDLSLW